MHGPRRLSWSWRGLLFAHRKALALFLAQIELPARPQPGPLARPAPQGCRAPVRVGAGVKTCQDRKVFFGGFLLVGMPEIQVASRRKSNQRAERWLNCKPGRRTRSKLASVALRTSNGLAPQ